MIVLKSGVNKVWVTLAEKTTIPNPVYIFKFTNDNTGYSYWCTNTDISNNKPRYNEFLIEVTNNAVWTDGELDLIDYGFYHYYVYEIATLNGLTYNDLPNQTLTCVEAGKMNYEKTEVAPKTYATVKKKRKAYNG